MSPNLRRALHQCVDILVDALSEEDDAKPKKRRAPSTPDLYLKIKPAGRDS